MHKNRNRNNDHLLKGPIFKQIVRLAAPMIIAFMFVTSYQYIDRFFVSRLGDIAIAAMGMAFVVQMVIISIGVGMGSGINSYIARSLGAKKPEKARNAALHTFLLGSVIGCALAIGGLLIQKPLFRMMGADEVLLGYIVNYLTIIFLFTPVNLLAMLVSSVFQGWGDTMSPMKYMLVGNILNLVFDYFLIFGIGPFPELGIKGAALATGIGRSVALLYSVLELLVFHKLTPLYPRRFKIDWKIIQGIFQVGFPSSISQILTSVAMGFVFFVLNQFGADAKAAYTIVFTYEMVIFLPAIGISQAVSILTGHNFGAGLFKRVYKIYAVGIATAFTVMAFAATMIFSFPSMFAGIFAQSASVLGISTTALQFTAVGAVFISVHLCSVASFQGMGMGRQYLWANIVRLYVFQIPLTYLGAHFFGLSGVWGGLMSVNILSALVVFLWHRYGFSVKVLAEGVKTTV